RDASGQSCRRNRFYVMSMRFDQIRDHRWPSGGDQPIAILAVPVEQLAEKCGFVLDEWEEDGLGSARGFAFVLPSGRIVLLYELAHMDGRTGSGANVSVDLGDLAAIGPTEIVAEVLSALQLPQSAIYWILAVTC
ncbi:MAG TPA: hypothetical protein VFQ48_04970, partial [Pseudonocardiaceae bacterium]|nr:hypothetical protein [Pseudonocardiaceae bacterium]